MRLDGRAILSRRSAASIIGGLALVTLVYCGGGSSSPTGNPTPIPTGTPAATPTPDSLGVCNPSPPPLYGIKVKIHDDSGFRKILDSRPQVVNVDNYCERAVGLSGAFCYVRNEGDQQAVACDSRAVGKATDTGRYGPTWSWNGKPCAAEGDTTPGCRNHPENQFLVIAKGPGHYEACANPDVPVAGDRCGAFDVR